MHDLWSAVTSSFGVLGGTIFLVIAVLAMLKWAATRYKKATPSQALIFYGRKYKVKIPTGDGQFRVEEFGFKPLVGGGKIVWPFVEAVREMSLSARTIEFEVAEIPTVDGVRVTVEAAAVLHISSEMEQLIVSAQKFEDKDDKAIDNTLKTVLSGQLRAILGKMTIEQLIKEREELVKKTFEVAEQEMQKLGVKIDILNILNIKDNQQYIDSLGVARTAQVKRDAAVGKAEAEREEAERVAAADQAGKKARFEADANIAEAERDLNKRRADYDAEVASAKAKASQAGPLAEAEAMKAVKLAQVAVQTVETEARIELANKEAQRREADLAATVLTQAEADRKAAVIHADAERLKQVTQADADRQQQIIKAEANFAAAAKQADAVRIAAEAEAAATAKKGQGQADAVRAQLLAEADGNKAKLTAEADGNKAKGLAVAASTEAQLLAEAKGKAQLAEALAKLNQTGQMLQILDAAPKVVEALGDALTKVLGKDGAAQIFQAIGAPLGSIDKVSIVDLNGGNSGSSPMTKLPNTVIDLFFNFLTRAKAMGFDFSGLLEKIGLNVPALLQDVTPGNVPMPVVDKTEQVKS